MSKRRTFVLMAVCVCLLCAVAFAANGSGKPVAVPFDGANDQALSTPRAGSANNTALGSPGDIVNFGTALVNAGNYLKKMQADITEDNAGNGSGGSESPNDPDDGGWDWVVYTPPSPMFHTTGKSPQNTYGVTALGLYNAYLKTNDATYFTAMQDAANTMRDSAGIRSAGDLKFLLLFNDLPGVSGTAYKDAAKAKYDARIAVYGSASSLARYIRDARGASYHNGIIGWDIGAWAVDAQMLFARYGGTYDVDADSIAEVLWQDSYNDNPGYFDVVDRAGWDPTWANTDYWWYTLGITGLLDAFGASNTHTSEIPDLLARLEASQFSNGAFSGSYGANATDEDWQSTAYAVMSLNDYDPSTYASRIAHGAYWTAATQDVSGAWLYSDFSHYPEIAGENTSAMSFGSNPSEVWVNSAWTSQAEVDAYNSANSTDYLFGYDAFGTIQDGIDAVSGSTVHVLAGTYYENVVIDKPVNLDGAGAALVTVYPAISGPNTGGGSLPADASVIMLVAANDVTISGFTLDGDNPGLNSGILVGGADLDARNGIITDHRLGIFNNLEIHDCTVKNIYLRGIYASSYGTFNFHHNTIQNVQAEYASIGMFNFGGSGVMAYNTVSDCNDAISSNHSKGVQFLYNVVTNSGSGVHTDNAGDGGGTADLIQGNQISNSPVNGYGIFVFAPYIAPLVQENTITNVDVGLTCAGAYVPVTVQFKNNTVDGQGKANSTGIYVTTEIWGYTSGNVTAEFTNNFIKNNVDGCYVVAEAGFTNSLKVFDNDISGNSAHSVLAGTGSMGGGVFNVDMSGNWWGSIDPATIKGSISGTVDYTPWLNSGSNTGGPGFYGDFSNLWVDDDSPELGTANRIQEAVNMVTGSTINIAPGTYVGQVHFAGFTNLNLIGSGIGSTIIQPPATQLPLYFMTSAANRPILFAENSVAVNISNLTVDGLGKGNINSRFLGVGYFNAGGTVDNCEIKDVRDTPIGGGQHGIGLYAYTTALPQRIVNVNASHVYGFQKGGITINGAYTTGNVAGCNIDGYGPAGFIAMNGVQLGFGTLGTVVNNQISGCSYTGPGWSSAGVLLYNDPPITGGILVRSNLIEECQIGINYLQVGGTIDQNTVTATPAGTGITSYWNIVADPGQGPGRQPKAQPFDVDLAAKSAGSNTVLSPMSITTLASNNILDGGGGGYGLEADAYAPEVLNFSATGNRLTNFEVGLVLWEESGATLTSNVTSNTMLFNGTGMYNEGGYVSAQYNVFANGTNASDLTAGNYYANNCYSDYNGIPPYNIGGGGGNVDNNPSSDCGLNMTPDNILYHCSGDFTVTVALGAAVTDLEAANIHIEYPAELNVVDVVSASSNYFVAFTQTNHAAGEKDTLKVNLGVLTGSQDGPADLFTITMNGSTSVCAANQLAMIYGDLRDGANNQIPAPLASPTTFVADCADPDVVVSSPANNGFFNVAPVLNLTATDDCDLSALYYQIDGCVAANWLPIASGLTGTTYNTVWTVPGFDGMSEAEHCVRLKVMDDNGRGNADSCTYTWCFTKDITPPAAPTSLVATPGHNKVNLSWTNASSDFDHAVIMRTDWYAGGHGYPEYDDANAEGPYPTTPLTGDEVYSGTGVTHADVLDVSNDTRDVYHYAAFTIDKAGNFSVPSNGARSTSYWLGDVATAYDGQVYFTDLMTFSSTYGLNQGDAGYNNEADFGPTHNYSPKGIPLTDSRVEFEDLAIFAINFDAVTPSAKDRPILTGTPIELKPALRLIERMVGNTFQVDLYLDNRDNLAKALIGEISFSADRLQYLSTTESADLANSTSPIFFKELSSAGKVSVSTAVLGAGRTFDGSGLIATLNFRPLVSGKVEVAMTRADIRDKDNKFLLSTDVPFPNHDATAMVDLPATYEVAQNQPNPFNPETAINYGLPTATDVSIRIYNVVGQLVKELVNEYQPAGMHRVVWNGTNTYGEKVASGIYFYRFETSDYQKTVKMTLMK